MTKSGVIILAALLAGGPGARLYSHQRESEVPVESRSGGFVHRFIVASAPTPALAEGGDPELEAGFPVSTLQTAGTYSGGPAIHLLVGNIDSDPELEILTTGLASGPLYAWNYDGTTVAGWPFDTLPDEAYPVLGEFSRISTSPLRRLEVFSAHSGFPGKLAALFGNAGMLLGWPLNCANFISSPGTAADVDANGKDEVFIAEEDGKLHAYRSNGTVLPGWPVDPNVGPQDLHTPAVADLDGAGDFEIITTTGQATGGAYLLAYYSTGVPVAGFPRNMPTAYTNTFPVVGDVDGDGALEILTTRSGGPPSYVAEVEVRSTNGAIERVMSASRGVPYGTTPALADLDGDGFPEIILQTEGALDVWKGDGTTFPGWPRIWSTYQWLGQSAPVVGDVTGDGVPDIVVVHAVASSIDGQVRVYDRYGNLHPSFPKLLPLGTGTVPAIADIDLDGRNEIIVGSDFWNGIPGMYPKVWAYDLGGGTHGSIQWGQFMGGPRHQGRYGQDID